MKKIISYAKKRNLIKMFIAIELTKNMFLMVFGGISKPDNSRFCHKLKFFRAFVGSNFIEFLAFRCFAGSNFRDFRPTKGNAFKVVSLVLLFSKKLNRFPQGK